MTWPLSNLVEESLVREGWDPRNTADRLKRIETVEPDDLVHRGPVPEAVPIPNHMGEPAKAKPLRAEPEGIVVVETPVLED